MTSVTTVNRELGEALCIMHGDDTHDPGHRDTHQWQCEIFVRSVMAGERCRLEIRADNWMRMVYIK